MDGFFFCVEDIVIDWESITKPRYSIDLAGTMFIHLGGSQILDCQEELQIFCPM